MRFFNTAGPVRPDDHYAIAPLDRMDVDELLARLRERLKGVNAAILPDLSRAMTASTLDAVAGRIGQALAPAAGPAASAQMLDAFAGVLQANEQAIEDGTWSWRQGLAGRTLRARPGLRAGP